jgi:hypothetical protein
MKRYLSILSLLLAGLFIPGSPFAATYDLTGSWNYLLSNLQETGICPTGSPSSGTCSVIQSGNTFTFVFLTGRECSPASMCTFAGGTVSGATYTASNSGVVDNEGGQASNTITFTASSSETAAGTGASTYTHPTGYTCNWTYELTLSKGPLTVEEPRLSRLCTDITGAVQPGQPVTFTAGSVGPGAAYYKFFYRAGYGTAAYNDPGNPWLVMQEFSTSNTSSFAFPSAGNYIVVVWAVSDPNSFNSAEVPLIGTNVKVGGSSGDIQFNCLPTDVSLTTKVGVPITFTAGAMGQAPIYYKFWYCSGYGTLAYPTNPWVVMQDFSTSNHCTYTFTAPGDYVVVIWAVKDPNNVPEDYPIIGMNMRVESQ